MSVIFSVQSKKVDKTSRNTRPKHEPKGEIWRIWNSLVALVAVVIRATGYSNIFCQTGRLLCYVLVLSVHLSVRLSVLSLVRYKTCEHKTLETNEPILMQTALVVHVARIQTINIGSGGQSSGSYEHEDRFRGLAEASFSTHLGQIALYRAMLCKGRLCCRKMSVCLSVTRRYRVEMAKHNHKTVLNVG